MSTHVRTKSEDVYSSLMNIRSEYEEMFAMLGKVKNCADAAAQGTKVDWTGIIKEIDGLQAFQTSATQHAKRG